jgi:hypothetical protein
MKNIKFIGQYTCSICGTQSNEIRDVLLIDNKLYIYCRTSSYKFELNIVEENDYNTKEFNTFINNPSIIKSDCNIIGGWRTHYNSSPKYLSEEYYLNIYHLNNHYKQRETNKQYYLNIEFNKFKQFIDNY